MNIKQSPNSFYIEQEGKQIAEIVYSTSFPGRLIIEHTEVDDEYEGQGIGKDLVHRAVDYANEQKLELVVRCSFARKVLEARM
jgi:predicted GNAT family acetyltransferase